jgi:hypothetical protein
MIFGHLGLANIVILVAGIISVLIGWGLLRAPREFEDAAAQIQRRLGPAGRIVASKRRPLATLWSGCMFVAFGLLFVALALLVQLKGET